MTPNEQKPEVKPETSEKTEAEETSEQKKEEVKPTPTPPTPPGEDKQILPKKRRIVIETDGNSATILTAEVAGNLELSAILQGLLDNMKGRR